jgi:hypothetical protein
LCIRIRQNSGLQHLIRRIANPVHDMCGRECRLLNILKILWGSDSVLKLPHRLTDNLREAKPSHVERVHVIILAVACSSVITWIFKFHCGKFRRRCFPSDHAAKTHIICFHLCRLHSWNSDSLRRFEMEFHGYAG